MLPLSQIALEKTPNNKSKAEMLRSKSKQDMAEMCGRISQILGFPRSIGQIYGLLYFSNQPLSLGELCIMLGVSKASTSTGTRQLATWGAIRKVWIPGERKDYYEAVEDLAELFLGSYRTIIKPRINSSQSRLIKIEASLEGDFINGLINQEEKEFMNRRLVKIKKMHGRITNMLPILEKLFS